MRYTDFADPDIYVRYLTDMAMLYANDDIPERVVARELQYFAEEIYLAVARVDVLADIIPVATSKMSAEDRKTLFREAAAEIYAVNADIIGQHTNNINQYYVSDTGLSGVVRSGYGDWLTFIKDRNIDDYYRGMDTLRARYIVPETTAQILSDHFRKQIDAYVLLSDAGCNHYRDVQRRYISDACKHIAVILGTCLHNDFKKRKED